MGTVFLAKELATERLVAMKVLRHNPTVHRRGFSRFRAEFQALARLQHPNIVQVFEVGVHGDEPFYTMEYCPGGSLADELRRRPPTTSESALLVEQLARQCMRRIRLGLCIVI